ncbi:MAG: hypothetical protein V4760_13080 [Bdellovibrionota bacterium]
MRDRTGTVTVNDAPTKSKLYRFCEKKIDQWIESRAADESKDVPIEFKVSFIEEDETRQVSCETEIRVQGHLWTGADLGSDEQQAFLQCLKRLHPH